MLGRQKVETTHCRRFDRSSFGVDKSTTENSSCGRNVVVEWSWVCPLKRWKKNPSQTIWVCTGMWFCS